MACLRFLVSTCGYIATVDLKAVLSDIADSLVAIDASRVPFKNFQPGVGPYGEPQLVKLISHELNRKPAYGNSARTKRVPDLLIPGCWALEIKIARPFGDNGKAAEDWSVNLLHPYPGNTSLLGDCLKLLSLECSERKAALVIGYEHRIPQIRLETLFQSFEVVARNVLTIPLGQRETASRSGLVHPVHQSLIVHGWQIP